MGYTIHTRQEKEVQYIGKNYDMIKTPYVWKEKTSAENVLKMIREHTPKKISGFQKQIKDLAVFSEEENHEPSAHKGKHDRYPIGETNMQGEREASALITMMDALCRAEGDNSLSSILSRQDLRQQDILHRIESADFSVEEGYRFALMLKDVREERRKVKILQALLPEYKRLRNAKYHPREYRELFYPPDLPQKAHG